MDNRRSFLKMLGLGSVASLIPTSLVAKSTEPSVPELSKQEHLNVTRFEIPQHVKDLKNPGLRSVMDEVAKRKYWQNILWEGINRNIIVHDKYAAPQQFTTSLILLMKTVMRRSSNTTISNNRGILTDLYVSPRVMEDIYTWDFSVYDDSSRRQIFLTSDKLSLRLFGVRMHVLEGLEEGGIYMNYFNNECSIPNWRSVWKMDYPKLPKDDYELVIGRNLGELNYDETNNTVLLGSI